MPRLVPLVALLVAIGATTVAPAGSLSTSFPPDGPDARTLAGWEKVEGEVETVEVNATYRFHVNPARGGIYEVTRYRVTRHGPAAAGRSRAVRETEKLLWNANPGREPIRCFELLEPVADSATGNGPTWRRLELGSAEYRDEMHTAILVYQLHRAAILSR